MQELVIVTSCDLHNEEAIEAEEVLWFVGDEPWVIDLCDKHRGELTLDDMADLVREHGRPISERRAGPGNAVPAQPAKKKRKRRSDSHGEPLSVAPSGRVLCPWPGCEKDYKNLSSVSGHFYIDHGIRYSNWQAEQEGITPSYFCVCGEAFVTSRSLTNHVNVKAEGVHHAVNQDT